MHAEAAPSGMERADAWSVRLLRVVVMMVALSRRSAAEAPPQFQIQPTGGIVPEGSTKILHCRASGDPQPDYRWIKDDVYLGDFSSNNFYKIVSASKQDVGDYSCIARNSVGSVLSNTGDVRVAYIQPIAAVQRALLSAKAGDALVIEPPPIDSYPESEVTWIGDGEFIFSFTRRKHIVTLQNALVILDVGATDAGVYSMEALNPQLGQAQYSGNVSVTVDASASLPTSSAPVIVVPPQNTTTVAGVDVVRLECIANVRPLSSLRIRWRRRQGDYLTSDNVNYVISPFGYQLSIKKPSRRHEGTYECVADADGLDYPAVRATAHLTVHEVPRLGGPPLHQTKGEVGKQVLLSCEADGSPAPYVDWYRNTVNVSAIRTGRYTVLVNGSLVIDDLKVTDTGIFQCVASNVAGETTDYTWLRVERSAPVWVALPSNMTVLDGEDVTVVCKVDGAPTPTVTWKFNGGGTGSGKSSVCITSGEVCTGHQKHDGKDVSSSSHLQILSSGDLFVADVKQSDAGVYRCEAANELGSVTASAHLTVTVRTQIIKPPVDMSVLISTTARMQCGVSHDPAVTVHWHWYWEDNVITPTTSPRHSVFDNGTLQVTDVRNTDMGNYTCWVVSDGGNDTRSALLNIVELPFPPHILDVVIMTKSKRSVNVSWAPGHDGNSPIESYLVQSRHVPTQGPALDWKVEEPSVPAYQPWLLVGNLKAATSYQFRVAARNGVGEGRFSDPSSIITLPQEPPGLPPVGVSASASSQTAIMVQWQQPPSEEWNGVLLGYIIRYRLAGYANSVPWQQVNITNEAQRNYQLRDLIVWQDYELQMAAYNNIGIGVYSNSITERTLEGVPTERPSRVTAVAGSSTTVNVTWKAINSQSVNGVALGYKVEAWLRDSSSAPARVISVAPSPYPDALHEEVVDALSKYTDYTITVLCYTAVGNGPASAAVAVRTMEDVPDQVANFTFLDIHDTRVSIWWSPPVNANGILTGYKLKYQQNDNVATENVLSFEPEIHNHTVTGLVPSTEYLFSIAASTSQGLGAVTTATIKSGVPPELPGPPTGLLVSNVMARSATLSFTPGYDGKTSISLWIVQARDKSSGEWGTIHEERSPEATALSVINLRPYTNYTLRLIASNVIGESAPSDPTQLFLTMQARPATAPSDIAARTVDANSITVHWVPLADDEWNGIPRGYSIQYEATSDDGGPPRPPLHMRAPDAYANSVVLSQLHAFTEYKIAVTSYNDVGSSPSSSTVLSKTKESVPTAGAAYVSATATGAQTILANWQDVPKAQQNGIILGYKVMYGGSDVAFTLRDVNDTRPVMLTGLRSFVNYSVQVLGYTRMGDGVLSDPVYNQTKEDVPGPPTSVFFPEVSYTTAMVNWDTPDEPNGIITNYKIQYWLEDTDSSSGYPPVELNENEHSYTAHNLQREKYYVFSITAKTRAGWGQSATVRVYTIPNRDKPGAPSKPTISASQILARSVTMSWQPGSDNYSPVRYYTVQMREGDNLAWKTHPESISPDLTFYTITDLTPYTKYSFRLQATNDKGASEWSTPSDTVVTEQDAPDEPPKQLQVLPYTETSVRITWVAPADHSWNGNKEGYLLEHRQYPSVSDFMETKVPNPQASNYTLEHLLGDREYEVRIKAYNRIGQSPPSAPETVYVGEAVPMESPQAVSAEMVNSTSIFATWLPPPEQTRNGDILGYKLYYGVAGSSSGSNDERVTEMVLLPAMRTDHLLTGLRRYKEYEVRTLAYNLAGDGPNSTAVRCMTDEDVPGKPALVRFTDIAMTSLNLSWSSPRKPNGVITGYKVIYRTANSDEGIKIERDMTADSYWWHVQGLRERVSYTFQVAAKTSKGLGPDQVSNITTGPQPGSPGSPSQPDVSESESSVTLSWNEGPEGTSSVTHYTIDKYKKDDEEHDGWDYHARTTGSETQFIISYLNLETSSDYRFRVTAVNKQGVSEPSEPTQWITTPMLDMLIPRPFYEEWWFLVIIALISLILLILVVAFLCYKGKNVKHIPKSESQIPTMNGDQFNTIDDGGFATFEMENQYRGSLRSNHSNRSRASRRSTSRKKAYARAPPRPSPGSVTYSDEELEEEEEGPRPYAEADPDSSSLTDKPSEYGDSTGDSQGSETDSGPDSMAKRDASAFTNHYAQASSQSVWRPPVRPPKQQHSYTDSDASQALNNGHIIINNMAGSRAPIPGFSSFV